MPSLAQLALPAIFSLAPPYEQFTAVTLGPVQLELGKEPRMGPCPICRKPRVTD